MDRKPLKSTNIESVGYDAATRTMHIEFKGGNVYEYQGVPESVHAAFVAAKSPGAHFASILRPIYVGRKLSK